MQTGASKATRAMLLAVVMVVACARSSHVELVPAIIASTDSLAIWLQLVRYAHTTRLQTYDRPFLACLSQMDDHEPDSVLLAKLSDLSPPVVPYSECMQTDTAGLLRHRTSGAAGLHISLGPIRRVDGEDELEGIVAVFRPGFVEAHSPFADSLKEECVTEMRLYFTGRHYDRVREPKGHFAECWMTQ